MRQAPRSPLSFKLQRVANVPERPPPSTRLMSCAHIADRRLSRIIGASNVFAYHLRVEEAVTANAAKPLVAGEGVRTPLGAFRVVFGIGHLDNQINRGPNDTAHTRRRTRWTILFMFWRLGSLSL